MALLCLAYLWLETEKICFRINPTKWREPTYNTFQKQNVYSLNNK